MENLFLRKRSPKACATNFKWLAVKVRGGTNIFSKGLKHHVSFYIEIVHTCQLSQREKLLYHPPRPKPQPMSVEAEDVQAGKWLRLLRWWKIMPFSGGSAIPSCFNRRAKYLGVSVKGYNFRNLVWLTR